MVETTFNEKFLQGSRGRFFQKEPPGKVVKHECTGYHFKVTGILGA